MAIDEFNKYILNETDIQKNLYFSKLKSCDCQIVLVTPDGPSIDRLFDDSLDYKILAALFSAWRSVLNDPLNTLKQSEGWRIIDQIGSAVQRSSILRHFNNDSGYDQYFVLLNGKEPHGIPFADLSPLCNICQLANGHFPLHSAGVIHKEQLFVFMGPSGAGKSTVTELSREIGDTTLDEDQLLIFKLAANEFRASAWGYNLDSCDLPVRAVFNLIQDTERHLVPMRPMILARLLFERHNDVMANQSPNELTKKSFAFFAEVARQIPGFELHFRKSPDFWKLIDEQFPR